LGKRLAIGGKRKGRKKRDAIQAENILSRPLRGVQRGLFTVDVALVSMFIGLFLGMLMALARFYHVRVARRIIQSAPIA
jgi:ABC-type amino acid transport system permease subunit